MRITNETRSSRPLRRTRGRRRRVPPLPPSTLRPARRLCTRTRTRRRLCIRISASAIQLAAALSNSSCRTSSARALCDASRSTSATSPPSSSSTNLRSVPYTVSNAGSSNLIDPSRASSFPAAFQTPPPKPAPNARALRASPSIAAVCLASPLPTPRSRVPTPRSRSPRRQSRTPDSHPPPIEPN